MDNQQLSPEEIKQQAYQEALRYMDNAEEWLKKAGNLSPEIYKDRKYVHTAAAIAYIVAMKSLNKLCKLHGIALVPMQQEEELKVGKKPKFRRPTISDYYRAARKLGEILGDPTMEEKLRIIYSLLHLYGYYDGTRDVSVIRRGMNLVYEFVNYLRPENPLPPLPLRPDNPFISTIRQVAHFLWPFRVS